MRRLVLAIVFAVVSLQSPAMDTDLHNYLYEKGTKLIEPYVVLSDRPTADASSPEARERLSEGIESLERVVEINPGNDAAYWVMGMAYRALGNYADATAAFGEAYEINPSQPDFAREYAYSCMCSGLTERAVEVAERVSALHPKDAGLMGNLGLALLADGQLQKARDATQTALLLDPDDEMTQRLMKEIEAVSNGKRASRYCH